MAPTSPKGPAHYHTWPPHPPGVLPTATHDPHTPRGCCPPPHMAPTSPTQSPQLLGCCPPPHTIPTPPGGPAHHHTQSPQPPGCCSPPRTAPAAPEGAPRPRRSLPAPPAVSAAPHPASGDPNPRTGFLRASSSPSAARVLPTSVRKQLVEPSAHTRREDAGRDRCSATHRGRAGSGGGGAVAAAVPAPSRFAPPRRREAALAAADEQPRRDMAGRRLLGLLLALAALLGSGHGDDPGDFSLEDALYDPGDKRPTPKSPRKPAGGAGRTGFDLADYFDTPLDTTTKPAKPTPKPFPRPGKPDNSFWDVIHTTTTKKPKTTTASPKRNPAKDPMDFDLADALDDKNDRKDPGRPNLRPGEGFSDDDLASIVDGGYSPDEKKGAGGNTDSNYGGVAETGTIAGIASALAMALIGAVSSYISYQQKKFCFSIQQGLNAEYVKGENMEAVVSEEPQVKYSVLETQSAEPPKQESAKM
uniref:CD99 antigen-like protein 2 n=1 Tax=Calidris pygmaea TaxID=425635 RepID=A0A8C3K034_9CHAR